MKKLFNISIPESINIVNVSFSNEGLKYSCAKAKFFKGKTSFSKEFIDFEDVKAIIKKFGLNIPYVISFQGKGILTKSFSLNDFAISKVIHGENPESFYFNQIQSSDKVFISFCRRRIIDEVLLEFNKTGCLIIDYGLEFLDINSISNFHNRSIQINNKEYVFVEEELVEFNKTDKRVSDYIDLNGKTIGRNELNGVGIATSNNIKSKKVEKTSISWISKNSGTENKQRKIFHGLGLTILAFFLIALVGNFLYLDHLNEKIVLKNNELDVHRNSIEELSVLKKEERRKKLVLKHSGLLNPNYLSFYTHEIGQSVPNEIQLLNVKIHPIDDVKKEKKLDILERSINISGQSSNSLSVQKWMDELNSRDWVLKIELKNYKRNKYDIGEFELEITLNV